MRTHSTVATILAAIVLFAALHAVLAQPHASTTIRINGHTCKVNDVATLPNGGTPNTVVYVHC